MTDLLNYLAFWSQGQTPCRRRLTCLWLGAALFAALFCLSTHAAAPAQKFGAQIARFKNMAEVAHHDLGTRLNELEEVPTFKNIDGPLITKHMEEVARCWTEAAAALEKGDESTAAALAQQVEKLGSQLNRWADRIHWRTGQAQHEYLPANGEIYYMLAAERDGDLRKEVEAFLEAKKRRSEAFGRLAEATTPAADRQTIFRLQDEVFALDVEVAVADAKYGWAREDWDFSRWMVGNRKLDSTELTAAKQRLAEWRRQREEAYRQSRLRQHALEQLDREHDGLLAAREEAYRKEKAAREAAKAGN